jgi:Holliday junction resolvasome RuvABC endonuclease subunit
VTAVVALDLSLTATGACRLTPGEPPRLNTIGSKAQKAPTYGDRAYRLQVLAELVLAFVHGIGHADLVVIEGPSIGSNNPHTWDRAGLWWLVVGSLHVTRTPTAVVPPSTLKKWATGKGNADKVAVAVHMSRLWPDLTAANDNEWDALALATMGAQHLRLETPVRAHHEAARAGAEWPPALAVAR